MKARVGNAVPPVRYQENALDLEEAGPEHRAKFEIGARLRYRGPSVETAIGYALRCSDGGPAQGDTHSRTCRTGSRPR